MASETCFVETPTKKYSCDVVHLVPTKSMYTYPRGASKKQTNKQSRTKQNKKYKNVFKKQTKRTNERTALSTHGSHDNVRFRLDRKK